MSRTPEPELERVYRQHADFVWRVLCRFGLDPDAAEDAMHDVFVVAQGRPRASVAAAWTTFLYGVARRVAANRRRSTARRLRAVPGLVCEGEAPVSPEAHLLDRERAALLEDFLRELPPAHREIFVLMEVEGLGGPEVATLMGLDLGAVHARLRVARRRLEAFVAAKAEVVREGVPR